MKYSKVAIIGPGLLGGSILMGLKSRQLTQKISVWARREEALQSILHQKLADHVSTQIAPVVEGAEVIILCTPIGSMPSLAEQMLPHISPSALITDVGSVKGVVDQQLAPIFSQKAHWIGSHPMAGSEQSGLDAARTDLFVNATVILTPTAQTEPGAEARARVFWENLGSKILTFSPNEHDRIVAQISHLPHLIASLLINSIQKDSLKVAGPGFRDSTRIAAGPAPMWSEILQSNRTAILETLDTFLLNAQKAKELIEKNDADSLQELLTKASEIRRLLTF